MKAGTDLELGLMFHAFYLVYYIQHSSWNQWLQLIDHKLIELTWVIRWTDSAILFLKKKKEKKKAYHPGSSLKSIIRKLLLAAGYQQL